MTATAEAKKMDRDDWIRGALAMIAEAGVTSVKIEPLAKRLGVTKGSFYWHFKNRPALLSAILAFWEEQQTETLFDIADDMKRSATEKLRRLYDTTVGVEADSDVRNVELAIRDWSRTDAAALMAVRSVDARRSVYVENFFMEVGCSEADAKARAGLFHGLLFSESLLARDEGAKERHDRVERSLALLIGTAEDNEETARPARPGAMTLGAGGSSVVN